MFYKRNIYRFAFVFGILLFSSLAIIRIASDSAEMNAEIASMLVDIVFKTLYVYDERVSRFTVDGVIANALGEMVFMKSFAGALVQEMERQVKVRSPVGGFRLLQWSCLLLEKSQFATVSKSAFCRVSAVQVSLLQILQSGTFRQRRACKRTFFHLFSLVKSLSWFCFVVLSSKFMDDFGTHLLGEYVYFSVTRNIQNVYRRT